MNNEVEEEYEEDVDEIDSEYNENEDEENLIRKRGRLEGFTPRKAILQFNEKCRVRFTEGDPNIILEVKGVNTENYRNAGYYGEMYSLIKNIIKINVKEKLFNKSEMVNIYEIIDILKQSETDAKEQAKNVIQAINNNEVVSSICQEGIDRCRIK